METFKRQKTEELLRRLQLLDRYKNKLTSAEFLQIRQPKEHDQDICEADLCSVYLHKLLMLDYRARYIQAQQGRTNETTYENSDMDDFFYIEEEDESKSKQTQIHPLDVQMAVFHCSDSFLQQKMVTKLSQCQDSMVFCFRLGSLSVSKSQYINTLINDRHPTFFHRISPGSTKSRLLFEGVAEIAWYCPSGKPSDSFKDCVAFCNLHGDGLTHDKQLNILMKMSSINVVFVPKMDRDHESATIIKRLLESSEPLIVLIENAGNKAVQSNNFKYRVGLKNRGPSDVSEELKQIIKDILSAPQNFFQLESMADNGFKVDEKNTGCTKGFSFAKEIIETIKSLPVSDIKKTFLPCQGQLWHDWCRINKEQYCLTELQKETERCTKLCQLKEKREEQCKTSGTKLMKCFISHLSSSSPTEREYFLKWTQILLDAYATDSLSSLLQNYHEKWSEVLALKKPDKSDKLKFNQEEAELKFKQYELAKITNDLQSATCGLEHIFREMAQIYEAHKCLDKPPNAEQTDWSKYPELAAELMIQDTRWS
ncbi:hypothetical protein WMY93_018379 [Mugilogobius chulae]|uniref:Uncharacterized protein n=1 Tax=Mugilogobius chulae TaxID=88201 RepID=A0AAW0NIP7_9GOBI